MKCKVYRSLDRPSSFFGLRGRFITVCAAGLGLSLAFALVVGAVTFPLVGTAVFLLGAAGSYLLATSIQGRMSERTFGKRILARKYPGYIRLRPRRFTSYL